MLRSLLSVSRWAKPQLRPFSIRSASNQSNQLVLTEINEKTGYATVSLNRPPVNSLSLELLQAICRTLDDLPVNALRGMILTSSAKSVFCAGLDINEMINPQQERLRLFRIALQDAWEKLVKLPFPTVAAVHGHAPAGGCLLAVSCDYRVMCPNYTIGANETALGLVAPIFFQESVKNFVSRRESELAFTLGKLYTTEEALKIRLVDEIAVNKQDALLRATSFLDLHRKISPQALHLTKQTMRAEAMLLVAANYERNIDEFVDIVNNPTVQEGFLSFLENLKKKKTTA